MASRISPTGNFIASPAANVAKIFSALCNPRRFVSSIFIKIPRHSGNRDQIVCPSVQSTHKSASCPYALIVMTRDLISAPTFFAHCNAVTLRTAKSCRL